MTKILIDQECIARGIKANVFECPVAKSLRQYGFVNLVVFPDLVKFFTPSGKFVAQRWLPLLAVQWINSYDKIGTADPFEFELEYNVADYKRDCNLLDDYRPQNRVYFV